jgi:Dehydrogenases with different specificities (related to short-chain alcohol dehydrogenases)
VIDKQRTIVITGADRGLGYELARQYAARGEKVFAGKYRTKWDLLDKLKEQYPDNIEIVEMDVGNTESVKKAAGYILGKTDSIDILINNAGIWLDHDNGTVLDDKYDYEKMLEQFNVNALGALRVTNALIKAVLNSFDKLVVNVSSEAGSITGCYKDTQPGYCMSKAAMNMQSCIILNGIKRHGGAVINLHPGWMQSVIGSSASADAEMVPMPEPGKVKFYTTPEITASGFIDILDEPERFASDKPGFVNYRGDVMRY